MNYSYFQLHLLELSLLAAMIDEFFAYIWYKKFLSFYCFMIRLFLFDLKNLTLKIMQRGRTYPSFPSLSLIFFLFFLIIVCEKKPYHFNH